MEPAQLKAEANALSIYDLAAKLNEVVASGSAPTTMEQAVLLEAAARIVALSTGYRAEIPDQVRPARHRLVVISPDKDTDYCYIDVSREEALATFSDSDDGAMYDQASPDFKVAESEFAGGFMLWRNMGNNMADMLGQRGLPPELANLLRGKD